MNGTGERSWRMYTTNPCDVPERDLQTINSSRLCDVVKEYGLTQDNWHFVPQIIFEGTEEAQRAYLQSIFGADGTVTRKTVHAGLQLRLGSSDLPLLEGVQQLLLNFGIVSNIYQQRQKAGYKLMPDGKGGSKEYWTKDFHELIISKSNIVTFANEIRFLHSRKNEYMDNDLELYVNGPREENFYARFDGVRLYWRGRGI